jgi:hypothetical protein
LLTSPWRGYWVTNSQRSDLKPETKPCDLRRIISNRRSVCKNIPRKPEIGFRVCPLSPTNEGTGGIGWCASLSPFNGSMGYWVNVMGKWGPRFLPSLHTLKQRRRHRDLKMSLCFSGHQADYSVSVSFEVCNTLCYDRAHSRTGPWWGIRFGT